MKPINDMLDDLDKQHMKEHRRSVFTEFKWFDPATGMGNFPVIYLRLIESLKTNF
jgi:hypothetical protein